jgi:hypothetical protein
MISASVASNEGQVPFVLACVEVAVPDEMHCVPWTVEQLGDQQRRRWGRLDILPPVIARSSQPQQGSRCVSWVGKGRAPIAQLGSVLAAPV